MSRLLSVLICLVCACVMISGAEVYRDDLEVAGPENPEEMGVKVRAADGYSDKKQKEHEQEWISPEDRLFWILFWAVGTPVVLLVICVCCCYFCSWRRPPGQFQARPGWTPTPTTTTRGSPTGYYPQGPYQRDYNNPQTPPYDRPYQQPYQGDYQQPYQGAYQQQQQPYQQPQGAYQQPQGAYQQQQQPYQGGQQPQYFR